MDYGKTFWKFPSPLHCVQCYAVVRSSDSAEEVLRCGHSGCGMRRHRSCFVSSNGHVQPDVVLFCPLHWSHRGLSPVSDHAGVTENPPSPGVVSSSVSAAPLSSADLLMVAPPRSSNALALSPPPARLAAARNSAMHTCPAALIAPHAVAAFSICKSSQRSETTPVAAFAGASLASDAACAPPRSTSALRLSPPPSSARGSAHTPLLHPHVKRSLASLFQAETQATTTQQVIVHSAVGQ